MLTLVWLAIIAIALLALVAVIVQHQHAALPTQPPPIANLPLRRGLFTLQLGDIVQYDGADWVVEGRLTFEEDGDTWLDYMLQDQDTIRWLSVEEGDRVEVYWMQAVTDLEVSDYPPQHLTYQDNRYRCQESGTARMTQAGTRLKKPTEICHYYDYIGPNDEVLSVENWGGDVEITIGHRIRPSALTLLPGDGQRVYDD